MGVLLPDASGCSKEKWGGGWMRDKKNESGGESKEK